jgi:ribosomal protein L11
MIQPGTPAHARRASNTTPSQGGAGDGSIIAPANALSRSPLFQSPPIKATTQSQSGDILPVVITVFKDKSFTFITKRPPAGNLLKKAAGLASGSGEPNKKKVGKISKAKLMEVVNIKMPDLNTRDPEAAARILAGTARQMGLEIEGM